MYSVPLLKSSERVVNIEINGQPSPLKMKLSKNGFAYFADEEDWYCESVEEDVVSENSESSGKTKENKENNLRRVKSLTDIVKIKREKDYPKSIEHANKYSNQIEDRLQISKLQLSLCGEDLNLGENRRLPISECKLLFEKSKIKIDDFLENPKIVFNEKLAVLFGNQVYPGSAFVPFVIGAMTFGSDKFGFLFASFTNYVDRLYINRLKYFFANNVLMFVL
ncbi:Lipin-3, variant 4 [Bonamia ostreae]|uniref:Lipin-3, variant 4 n=1 Tax=Bonamia ostreae TaxID=126728 RepID=A0ABV2AI81_9EUKA